MSQPITHIFVSYEMRVLVFSEQKIGRRTAKRKVRLQKYCGLYCRQSSSDAIITGPKTRCILFNCSDIKPRVRVNGSRAPLQRTLTKEESMNLARTVIACFNSEHYLLYNASTLNLFKTFTSGLLLSYKLKTFKFNIMLSAFLQANSKNIILGF